MTSVEKINLEQPTSRSTLLVDEKLLMDAQLFADGSNIHKITGLCGNYRMIVQAFDLSTSEKEADAYQDLAQRTELKLRKFVREARLSRARNLRLIF